MKVRKKWTFSIKSAITVASVFIIIFGIVTLDWFRIGFGVILYLLNFLFYYIKQRKYLKDNEVYTWYKIVSDIKNAISIHVINEDNYWSICLLFYIWLVSWAINYFHMNNTQSLNLFNAVFHDIGVKHIKEDQLSIIMFNAIKSEKNIKVTSFWMETFTRFLDLWKTSLLDVEKHLMNDFGTVNFKL
jgi:hypothetical protein